MFGYVQIRKPELKIKDYEVYHGFYCGLCTVLKEQYGFLGEITLTYDMTFLVILLSSVYHVPVKRKKEHCILHPVKRHLKLSNEMTEYAAHLNMILSYYHFLDDKKDENSKKAWTMTKLYYRRYKRAAFDLKEKEKEICKCLKQLSVVEQEQEADAGKPADCFGRLVAELFDCRKDAFSDYFRDLGYHLGRFIYIMDAYDDLEKDVEKGSYNPFKLMRKKEHFEQTVEELLLDEISKAAAAFEKLPCLSYRDILRNILYAGVWNRFDQIRLEKKKKRQEEKENVRSI